MSIRLRIILGFLLTIFLTAIGGTIFSTLQMRDDANEKFAQTSRRQLALLNDYLDSFIKTARTNAAILATTEGLAGLADIIPNFSDTTESSDYASMLRPEARQALAPLRNMSGKNLDYLETSMPASARGSSVRTIPPKTGCCPTPMCR